MSSPTPRLAFDLIDAAAAQKHVPHNEAILKLDVLVAGAVKDRDLAAPPGSPAEGDTYLVAASPTGAWAGQAGKIAYRIDGGWRFYAAAIGLSLWIIDEAKLLTWDGTQWLQAAFQNIPMIGVNATADSTNKLSVASNAVLFNAVVAASGGNGDMQFKVNKETAGDTASFLFQTGFSGRAEFGTIGNDDFTLKVSPDGSAWTDSFAVDKTSAVFTFKATAVLNPQAGDPASPTNGQLWYNSTTGKFRGRQAGTSVDMVGGGGGGGTQTLWLTGSVTGTNTITAAATPTLSSYPSDGVFVLAPANANTGAVTLNIDSQGAKSVLSPSGGALAGGELVASQNYLLRYDGTNFKIIAPF
jgi:hypothetical protein